MFADPRRRRKAHWLGFDPDRISEHREVAFSGRRRRLDDSVVQDLAVFDQGRVVVDRRAEDIHLAQGRDPFCALAGQEDRRKLHPERVAVLLTDAGRREERIVCEPRDTDAFAEGRPHVVHTVNEIAPSAVLKTPDGVVIG